MVELQSRADHLQQENDHMQARLEGEQLENARGGSHPTPSIKQSKGKEPIRPDNSDAAADDELSSGSSSLPDLPLPKNNVKAESRKRPHVVPTNPSATCLVAYRENLAERGKSHITPLKTYSRGRGAQHHHIRFGTPPLELHQPRICLHPLLFGNQKICCPPHWSSTS